MIVLLWLAFGVAVTALLVAAVVRVLNAWRSPPEGQHIVLISVAEQVQDAARWHLDQGQRAQALRIVRRSAAVGPSEAVAVVNALAAEQRVPTSYEESIRILDTQYPELAARLRQLAGQGQLIAAMQLLRRNVPVTLIRAKFLIDTLAR